MSNLTQLSEREKIILETKLEVLEEVRLKVEDMYEGEITEEYYMGELDRELKKLRNKLNPVAVVAKPEKSTPDFSVRDEVNYNDYKFTVVEVDYNKRRYKINRLSETHFVSWDDENLKEW